MNRLLNIWEHLSLTSFFI